MSYTNKPQIKQRIRSTERWIPVDLADVRELAFQAYSELLNGDNRGPIEFEINEIKFLVSR